MPDASGFPTPDEIINGFGKKVEPTKLPPKTPENTLHPTEAQQKAIGIILSGLPFIVIGLNPTENGCDFHHELGFTTKKDKSTLNDAKDHLPGVIERLYKKNGIDIL